MAKASGTTRTSSPRNLNNERRATRTKSNPLNSLLASIPSFWGVQGAEVKKVNNII